MKRVARPGGTVGFYVWDYPGGGMEFMRAFWTAAAPSIPRARDLSEDRRFPFCTPDGLTELVTDAGLTRVECVPIEVPTVFRDFDDYWRPFTLGAGPAPGYCASLDGGAAASEGKAGGEPEARARTALSRSRRGPGRRRRRSAEAPPPHAARQFAAAPYR